MSFGKFTRQEIIDLISGSWSPYWGGTGTPGGPENSIQFNSGSFFSGSNNFTFNPTNNSVSLTGSLLISGSSSVAPLIITSTTTPTAVAGGIYFDGTDFYLGFV